MAIINGWFDWCERIDGPPSKRYAGQHIPRGVVLHSAVGTFQGVVNVVMGPDSNERSVTGVFGKQGRCVQFYSLLDAPWANGNGNVNRWFRGFENEGGRDIPSEVSEPLTEPQLAANVRAMREMRETYNIAWSRPMSAQDMDASAWEHNEMKRFGALGTACPSARIPWATVFSRLSLAPATRYWVCGDARSGLEKVGNQTIVWNNGIPGNVYGNSDGTLPGALYHLIGPDWSRDWLEIYK